LWRQIDVIEATPAVAQSAGDLAESQGLRGYDAMHLASALVLGVDVVVTADRALLAATKATGLAVIDARS
jgi:predicted nucleic acid-binding protein